MEPSVQDLLRRLDRLTDEFRELREGVAKAVHIADEDPEMALTRARKVLELVVRDVYERHCQAPPGTQPLENLIQRLVKDGHFPRKVAAYANAVRDLGNVGTHVFDEKMKVTTADVYQSLTQLIPVLEWYFESERPEALADRPAAAPPSHPGAARGPVVHPAASPRRRWPRAAWRAAGVGGLAALVGLAVFLSRHEWPRPSSSPPGQQGNVTPAPATPRTQTTSAAAPPRPTPAPILLEVGLRPSKQAKDEAGRDTCLTYQGQREKGVLHVCYHLPYLERQRAGKAIGGLNLHHPPFDWSVPVLSVKVLNNAAKSVMLTECVADVTASRVDAEPVLVVADGAVNSLLFVNEGWGDVVDPVLTFKMHRLARKGNEGTAPAERHTLELKTFARDSLVRLTRYVPKELEDEPTVAVSGELAFGPAKRRRRVPFTTTMIFDITFNEPVPPSYQYDLALTAGKAPDTVRVPISHNVRSGGADQFLLRIASDKSAHYEFKLRIRLIDGRWLPVQNVVLDVFVPRSMATRAEKASAVEAARPGTVP